jgi:hypothetical protein
MQNLLVIDGVKFFRNRKRGDLQYWKCSNYYKNKCPCFVVINEERKDVKIKHEHTH